MTTFFILPDKEQQRVARGVFLTISRIIVRHFLIPEICELGQRSLLLYVRMCGRCEVTGYVTHIAWVFPCSARKIEERCWSCANNVFLAPYLMHLLRTCSVKCTRVLQYNVPSLFGRTVHFQ